MSSGDVTRGKGEQLAGRDRHREYQPVNGTFASSSGTQSQSHQDGTSQPPGSLRSRIGDKEGPSSLPQTPVNPRSEIQRVEDDRDNRKRTVSGGSHAGHNVDQVVFMFAQDRDKDVIDVPQEGNEATQPPKRARIVLKRDRYSTQPYQPTGGGALARKLLGMTDDKSRGRKDR